MYTDEQIALLKDVSASIAFYDRQAAADELVIEGYLVKDGDSRPRVRWRWKLTPQYKVRDCDAV